jgi:GR25 family glycosyltransferase involved in LPS biosynthesis
MSKYIDKIIYINLSHRIDRREQIENELNNFNLNYERIEAIPTPGFGIHGCGLSHLSVLKIAKERIYKNILILEDDFEFLVTKEVFEDNLSKFFESNIEYNVCMLSYNLNDYLEIDNSVVNKVIFAQTASGYIVNSNYYNKLIELYEWCLPLLISTRRHWLYANDIVWKDYQKQDLWYYFKIRIGRQRASYSDNALCFHNYGI